MLALRLIDPNDYTCMRTASASVASAMRALKDGAGVELGAKQTIPGTVSAALISYYQSTAFTDALAKITQQCRRAILEGFRAEHGDKRVALMHATALQNVMNKKTPAAQRNSRRRCAASSIIA